MYDYSMSSAYTDELAGDPPDLPVGISGDLHLLFGELVGVLNLGTLGTLLRSCVLCDVSFEVGFLKYS